MDIMEKVLEYIGLHYHEKITLANVAEQVFLSRSYFSKFFNEQMNCSFTDYINGLRVAKSETFLLDSGLPIAEVANMVGFEDQSYFTKVFKKFTGVSPGRYRETRRNHVA